MTNRELSAWLDEQSVPNVVWYVKRLSGNDTLANASHQAGPYVPRELFLSLFPSIAASDARNPDRWFELRIDSHRDVRQVRAIWYNNKLRGRTRNEARLTNFGGATSALLDANSTGSLAVFAFHQDQHGETVLCRCWVCDEAEADLVEDRIGPVEPGSYRTWSIDQTPPSLHTSRHAKCWLEPDKIPEAWRTKFPTGLDIIRKTVQLRPARGIPVDRRLMQRRECEYEMFRSLEENVELPLIRTGFTSIDGFVARAQTILQRRKARSGRSLELHTRELLLEEQLNEGRDFSYQPESDPGQRPDFLFPSQQAYQDVAFPADRLRMLAVKTTCKDRWRQILTEASRIEHKHLLTLQEGVSEAQFREMQGAGVQLVVPEPLFPAYPVAVRPHLQTLASFFADIRVLGIGQQ